jgi:hypothetical protein
VRAEFGGVISPWLSSFNLLSAWLFQQLGIRTGLPMDQIDWAKIYAKMDKRIVLKYAQLPNGEQIGKQPRTGNQQQKIPHPMSKELI